MGKLFTTTGTMASTLGLRNPLRQRGYTYDRDTGFYYLQSRYYDPQIGRFINADSLVSTGQGVLGHNMFAYCNNGPVSFADANGYVSVRSDFAMYLSVEGGSGTYIAPPTYICRQDDPEVGSTNMGLATIAHGGCGVVATYNALITLGEGISLSQVLGYYSENGDLIAGGLLGMLPNAVASYFSDHGYRVFVTDDLDEINLHSQNADACILWYVYTASWLGIDAFGAHFIEYHKAGNSYIGCNTNDPSGISRFNNPSKYGYQGARYYAVGIFIYK